MSARSTTFYNFFCCFMRLNVSQVILGSGNLSHSAFHALRSSIPPKDLIFSFITPHIITVTANDVNKKLQFFFVIDKYTNTKYCQISKL